MSDKKPEIQQADAIDLSAVKAEAVSLAERRAKLRTGFRAGTKRRVRRLDASS